MFDSLQQNSRYKLKQNYYLKNNTSIRNSQKNLKSQSSISIKNKSISQTQTQSKSQFFDNGVKLQGSYYNDRQNIYIKRSRALSQKSLSYQSKQISFSERRKYSEKKIQNVVESRIKKGKTELNTITNKTMSLPSMHKQLNKQVIRTKMNSLNAKKFSQLIHGTKPIQNKIKFLRKQVKQKRQESVTQNKWMSPFRDTNTFKNKFEGKNVIPRKISGLMVNSNASQLKVLNLDRLFRIKNGKLGNVVPIPAIKLSGISTRQNVTKSIKKKDTIHDIIQEFNRFLKLSKVAKSNKKIGIRGHKFTKAPTLEQLMGIKVHQFYKSKEIKVQDEQLSDEFFLKYNQFYNKQMKKDIHLARRLLAGLKTTGKLNLQAYIRFYTIFVNKVASLAQKINFLLYFFIPHGQQKIQLGVLKLILQLMCEQLPQISNLKAQSQFLTKQQKSKIFLQALNRVLFGDLKEFTGQGQVLINRNILEMLLQRNQDAVSLLIRLLLVQ